MSCPVIHAITGIITCKRRRIMIKGSGLLATPLNDEKLEPRLPENVISAKIQGIKNERLNRCSENMIPIITLAGVINGMNFSSCRFNF
jgi:hypothetical protein